MTAVGGMEQTEMKLYLKNISVDASIRDNCFACVMYYLNCVQSVTDEDFPGYMTDYDNFRFLTRKQKDAIVWEVQMHPPESVQAFFAIEGLSDGSSNRFFEGQESVERLRADFQATNATLLLHIDQMVAKRPLGRLMLYTKSWKASFYDNPLCKILRTQNLCSIQ